MFGLGEVDNGRPVGRMAISNPNGVVFEPHDEVGLGHRRRWIHDRNEVGCLLSRCWLGVAADQGSGADWEDLT